MEVGNQQQVTLLGHVIVLSSHHVPQGTLLDHCRVEEGGGMSEVHERPLVIHCGA